MSLPLSREGAAPWGQARESGESANEPRSPPRNANSIDVRRGRVEVKLPYQSAYAHASSSWRTISFWDAVRQAPAPPGAAVGPAISIFILRIDHR